MRRLKGQIRTGMQLHRKTKTGAQLRAEREEWKTIVNNPRNWHVPLIGEPYLVDPRNKQIISGVTCPEHVLRKLGKLGPAQGNVPKQRQEAISQPAFSRPRPPSHRSASAPQVEGATKPTVSIYTNGACARNPRPGGYAAVLLQHKQGKEVKWKEIYGVYRLTTNNRMEIMAVMKALEALREHCQVYLYSDSQYVVRQGNGSNAKELPGSPDIAFPSAHLAVFVHGCFWHRCPYCNPHFPESNVEYWSAKFERNRRRDRDNRSMFRTMAWKVLTVWECQLRNSPGRVVARIIRQPEQVQIDMRQ